MRDLRYNLKEYQWFIYPYVFRLKKFTQLYNDEILNLIFHVLFHGHSFAFIKDFII